MHTVGAPYTGKIVKRRLFVMPLFISPGHLCSSKTQFRSIGAPANRDHSNLSLRPGPICTASFHRAAQFELAPVVDLLPLQFTSGQSCRRLTYSDAFERSVKKEAKVLVAVIVGGNTSANPFGHVAIAIEGYGTYSFGTKTMAGTSLSEYLAKQSEYLSHPGRS